VKRGIAAEANYEYMFGLMKLVVIE